MSQSAQPTAPHPSLNAMLACDRAIRDPQTRNTSTTARSRTTRWSRRVVIELGLDSGRIRTD
jgi:hypothetical protein